MAMDVADFISGARHLLAPILSEPGGVLYSSWRTLRRGDYYFLGLNPGGAGGDTIAASLDTLLQKESNSYVDECWENRRGTFKRGAHPLQRNARRLFEALGIRVEDVCASNLIFSQSSREGGAGYPDKADICWPVHQLILEIVQPRAILTFGRQPFDFMARQLKAEMRPGIPTGRGTWRCRVGHISSGPRVIGLPHLSWFSASEHLLSQIRDCLSVERPTYG